MNRKSIVAVLSLLLGIMVNAQDKKSANTLLWRISGKGLTKPSYLYGTMHLTDKRVFQLGDSVLNALEKTEGFAAELDMDRIGTQMMNQFLKEQDEKNATEPVKLKDAVNADLWNKYKETLEKKLGKKAEKITVDDLDHIESKLQTDIFRKGDMPTFLDAWLSGQARKQGKWVGGIEDLEDQLEHKDDIESKIQLALFDDNYYRGGVEWLINVYTKQQLDTIDAFMYREANGRKDYIMIKRNVKMARRMDSLSAIRSTLFAVGAAHLPGDSGVVSLLRSRGFTVTPVFSSRKINPDKYISKTVDLSWTPVAIADKSYSIQMPGVAESLEMLESMGLDMKLFFDMSFMKFYMTMGVDVPEERRKLGADSMYKAFKSRYSTAGNTVKEKKITINGVAGREYRISTEAGEMKMQVLIPSPMDKVVLNMVFAFNERSLDDSDTEKFFGSFVYHPDVPKAVIAAKSWNLYEYPHLAFSIEMPAKPKEKKDVVSQEGKIVYEWQVVDLKDQYFYGMSVSTMKEMMYDEGSDTVYFETIKEKLRTSFENPVIQDSAIYSIDGHPAFKLSITGNTESEKFETKILAVSRGGISYYIFAVYPPTDKNKTMADRFLRSFRMNPYNYPEWKTIQSPDGSFSTTSAFPMRKLDKEEVEYSSTNRYIVYDTLAYVTGFIDHSVFPDWFWYSSDTALLRYRSRLYESWNDSISNYKLSASGNMKIADFSVIKPGDNVVKRVKLIINGNELYELIGNFSGQDLKSRYERFFSDFNIAREKPDFDFAKPKLNALVRKLAVADKAGIEEIKHWWEALEFSAADVPVLQESLLRLYADYDSSYYSNMNAKLFDVIESFDSMYTTVSYIRNNYNRIKKEDEFVKGFVISYLAGIKTAESYKLLKDCILSYPASVEKVPYFSYIFYDSTKLAATLFPEILKQGASVSLWDQVATGAIALSDSNTISGTMIREYGRYFVETGKRELKKEKSEIEENPYYYSDLVKLLGIIGTPEAVALLKQFSKFDAREIKFRTFIALQESNQAADSKTAYTLAMTDEYRHKLYDELKRINKLRLFPASHLSQKELGKSKLYEYGTEDEAEPGMIFDAGERIILYKGKQQKFYLYKFSLLDTEEYYLGVAGPYPINAKEYNSSHEATGVHWEEEFDAKKIDQLFKDYLTSLEPENEEAEGPPPPPKSDPPGVQIIKRN